MDNKVRTDLDENYYNDVLPYNLSEKYPEYIFGNISAKYNIGYGAVRNLFIQGDFDKKNVEKLTLNLLKDYVYSNTSVLIKLNVVLGFFTKC